MLLSLRLSSHIISWIYDWHTDFIQMGCRMLRYECQKLNFLLMIAYIHQQFIVPILNNNKLFKFLKYLEKQGNNAIFSFIFDMNHTRKLGFGGFLRGQILRSISSFIRNIWENERNIPIFSWYMHEYQLWTSKLYLKCLENHEEALLDLENFQALILGRFLKNT